MKDYKVTIKANGAVVVDQFISQIPSPLLPMLLVLIEAGEYTLETDDPAPEDLAERIRIEITARSLP